MHVPGDVAEAPLPLSSRPFVPPATCHGSLSFTIAALLFSQPLPQASKPPSGARK